MLDIDFINNVTIRMCGSLDIHSSLKQTYEYMKKHIPLDEIFIDSYDKETHEIRRISAVSSIPKSSNTHKIKIPKELDLFSVLDELGDVWIINSEKDLPAQMLGSKFISEVNLAGKSEVVLHAKSKDKHLGFVVLRSKGTNVYAEKHKELLQKLREPFALAIQNALTHMRLEQEKVSLEKRYMSLSNNIIGYANSNIAGSKKGIKKILNDADHVVDLDNTILITGETGVGKEVVANYIYKNSKYENGPFVKVNCGAIPESLIDSELFGYEKGAFTGASGLKKGKFERADGGILFLDEIGELPMSVQSRLLRFLQFKEIERLGGKAPIKLNVRVIAATNKDLEKMVKDGKFREDLWYRLSVFPIHIPPLRERREDIPYLIEYMMDLKCTKLGIKNRPEINNDLMRQLVEYDWPGNVREMENVVERAYP
jgi:transcriptional regulator with GAF, ATPase, and Fis domain